jgi:hypothetical protein
VQSAHRTTVGCNFVKQKKQIRKTQTRIEIKAESNKKERNEYNKPVVVGFSADKLELLF